MANQAEPKAQFWAEVADLDTIRFNVNLVGPGEDPEAFALVAVRGGGKVEEQFGLTPEPVAAAAVKPSKQLVKTSKKSPIAGAERYVVKVSTPEGQVLAFGSNRLIGDRVIQLAGEPKAVRIEVIDRKYGKVTVVKDNGTVLI